MTEPLASCCAKKLKLPKNTERSTKSERLIQAAVHISDAFLKMYRLSVPIKSGSPFSPAKTPPCPYAGEDG